MFTIKNYYAILQVEPSATVAEIKKAYRKLALQYHPDKYKNDTYATAQFAEIKEAYEVLTDPAKKDYYLQQRWYNQSMGYQRTKEIITPVTLLKQSLELEKYVSRLDIFRMDKLQLQQYLLEILNDDTIDKVNLFNETAINRNIISVLLKTIHPLPSNLAEPVVNRLLKLAGTHEHTKKLILEHQSDSKQRDTAEKFKPLGIAFLTLLICLLIWLMNR